MLFLRNLTKTFDNVKAVEEVSLKVKNGDIYGFLGPNGAGKTTTIRMIMGIIQPDSGEIIFNGEDMNYSTRNNLGYLPEDRGLYQKQRIEDILHYFGLLRGLQISDVKYKTEKWLDRFQLTNQKKRKVEELSKGNQQKVQFILALFHEPELIILDEPFTGLDPFNQILLKEIIQEYQNKGKTIIFSTHQMEQVEQLCNNICLINKGKIIVEGKLDEIQENHTSNNIEVRYSGFLRIEELEKYLTDVKMKNNKISGGLIVEARKFIEWLNRKVDIAHYKMEVPTLEQIFINEVRESN